MVLKFSLKSKFSIKEASRGEGVCSKIAMLEVASGSMKVLMIQLLILA